jgi:hypothetical protein
LIEPARERKPSSPLFRQSQGNPSGYAVKPANDSPASGKRMSFPSQDQEGSLGGIFRGVVVVEDAPADALD